MKKICANCYQPIGTNYLTASIGNSCKREKDSTRKYECSPTEYYKIWHGRYFYICDTCTDIIMTNIERVNAGLLPM